MFKRILSVAIAMLMLIPFVLSLTSCEKARTEEEIIDDIVNSGTTALTLSIWIPTNSDSDSKEFKDRLLAVEGRINEILRDKNYSTEIELTAVSIDEYQEKLNAHLDSIEHKINSSSKGILPSMASKNYKNKAVKVPYGDSYMYELAYPKVLDTQLDLFYISGFDIYKSYISSDRLYDLSDFLSKDKQKYSDIHKMISQSILAQYFTGSSIYAIPNNHQYSNAQYQYILIDKEALASVDGFSVDTMKDILSCEEFINAIGADSDSGFVPFVGSINDAPNVIQFGDLEILGSTYDKAAPSNKFDIDSYTNYVKMLKSLQEKSYAKETLEEGEKAAISFFYGTADEAKQLEDRYYLIKSGSPIAQEDEIYSSMFAISKYAVNYERAMKVLYLLQTDSEVITLLQYGIEDQDYVIETNESEENVIKVTNDAYDMSGLNLGNSYHTYRNDGSVLDAWDDIKMTNLELEVSPYLYVMNKFNAKATDEEKEQLKTLVEAVSELSKCVNTAINNMTSEEYAEFIELLKVDIAKLTDSISSKEAELKKLNEAEEKDNEKIEELEKSLAELKAQKSAYDANETVKTVKGSVELSSLIALYSKY